MSAPVSTADAERLDELVWLSRELGRPQRDLVVLAEGNTSALGGRDDFLVKASGARLESAGPQDFVSLALEPILDALLDGREHDVAALMRAARAADSPGAGTPSIETFVHAACLGVAEGRFVAHTHPTQLVGLLCSERSRAIMLAGPLFPDEAVICGPTPLYIDYHEPGIELGRALVAALRAHADTHGAPPRTVFLANHGVVAIGRTAREALAVTEMAVKAARVRAVALAAGGMRPLRNSSAAALARRPDEIDRRALLAGESQ